MGWGRNRAIHDFLGCFLGVLLFFSVGNPAFGGTSRQLAAPQARSAIPPSAGQVGNSLPTNWDAASGRNIKWKTRLPNWSNGTPLAAEVSGGEGRVFVMSEAVDYAPILTCLDANTGKKLWETVLDPIPQFPQAEQAAMRKLAQESWEWNRKQIALWKDIRKYIDAHKADFGGAKPNSKIRLTNEAARPAFDKEFGARLDELGLTFKEIIAGAGGEQMKFHFKEHRGPVEQRIGTLQDAGLAWGHWTYFGTWTGNTFGSPCTDGERVFTVTGNNLFSAHDLSGRLVWQRRFPWPHGRQAKNQLTPGQQKQVTDANGKLRWPFNTQGLHATSPVCADGRLISMAGAMVRCLDGATGKTVWEFPMRGGIGQNCVKPAVVRLGGEAVVIIAPGEGRLGADGDDIVRVRDGKVVGLLPGTTNSKMAIDTAPVEGDTVWHYSGDWRDRSLSASRLSVAGDKGNVEPLWTIKMKSVRGMGMWRIGVKDGLLYHGDTVFDGRTGKLVKNKLKASKRNYCWRSNRVVGDVFVSIDHAGGMFTFRDIKTHKVLGQPTLPKNPPELANDKDRAERIRVNSRSGGSWSVLGAASPVAHKDRLYIRSFDYLWCIGK